MDLQQRSSLIVRQKQDWVEGSRRKWQGSAVRLAVGAAVSPRLFRGKHEGRLLGKEWIWNEQHRQQPWNEVSWT